MQRRDHHIGVLAVVLAGLAGFVDAVGFLTSGGYFVSFMSGNSTRLGVGLGSALEAGAAAGSAAGFEAALLALALIAAFVAGTVTASLLRRGVPERAKESAVLGLVAGLMAVSALLERGEGALPLLPLAAAMGAMNLAFEVGGDVRVGLTYMTGTLVKLGLRLADALSGGARTAWLPYLVLWLGLVLGGVIGAGLQMRVGGAATWFAGGLAALVAVIVGIGRRRGAA